MEYQINDPNIILEEKEIAISRKFSTEIVLQKGINELMRMMIFAKLFVFVS